MDTSDGVFLILKIEVKIVEKEKSSIVNIGNITFNVISKFVGTASLEHLIKRLIREEIKQSFF